MPEGTNYEEDEASYYPETPSVNCWLFGENYPLDSDLDCLFYRLPYFLQHYYFDVLTALAILPLLGISIFSNIKESYRWFILNQVVWDLFIIYDVRCNAPRDNATIPQTCLYSSPTFNFFKSFFTSAARFGLYSPIFLLAFSRKVFLCLYYNRFYKTISHPLKLLPIFVIFQLIIIVAANGYDWSVEIISNIIAAKKETCNGLDGEEVTVDDIIKNKGPIITPYSTCCEQYYNVPNPWFIPALNLLKYITAPCLLFFSDFFAVMVILKLGCNFGFQVKSNRANLMSSIKISIVMGIQCVSLTLLGSLTLIQTLIGVTDAEVPPWFFSLTRNWTIEWYCVIRIFIDSLIMLGVLTDYRQRFAAFLKYFISPRLLYSTIRRRMLKPSTTVVQFLR